MMQSIWILVVDGMDRVFVQTREPTTWQRDATKPSRVFRIDVEIPDVTETDGVIRIDARVNTLV